MWNQIKDNKDLMSFMTKLDSFHDSCIKEIRYSSGAYVDEGLAMFPINDQRKLSVIIQRQFRNLSMIEMEFSGLEYLRLSPLDVNYTCEIHDSTMYLSKGHIYWCDCGGVSEFSMDSFDGTIICASQLRWRAIENCMGHDDFYLARQ